MTTNSNIGAYTRDELADARVAAGMVLLDRYSDDREEPHWRERINRDRIDVASFTRCPLAQTFNGDFNAGVQALLDSWLIEFDDDDWPRTYGFDEGQSDDGVFLSFADLTAAWRRALPPTHAAPGIFGRLAAAWRRARRGAGVRR